MFEAEMTMTIKNIRREDLGSYICVAKNSLGDVESKIRLYGKYKALYVCSKYRACFLPKSFAILYVTSQVIYLIKKNISMASIRVHLHKQYTSNKLFHYVKF